MRLLIQVSAMVVGEWLLVTPPENDFTRRLNEWRQEQSFDTLEECARYRVNQADEMIKRMTYRRAIEAGARSLEEPSHLPYGDRRGMVGRQVGQYLANRHMFREYRIARAASNRGGILTKDGVYSCIGLSVGKYVERSCLKWNG